MTPSESAALFLSQYFILRQLPIGLVFRQKIYWSTFRPPWLVVMPQIRADHGLSPRNGDLHAGATAEAEENHEEGKEQPLRSTPTERLHSPSHSRTPTSNEQAPSPSGMATVRGISHGHVFAHGGAHDDPSSNAGNPGGGSSRNMFHDASGSSPQQERRQSSHHPARASSSHAHSQQGLGSKSPAFRPPSKGPPARGGMGSQQQSSWGVSSLTPGVGGDVGGRVNSAPTLAPESSCTSGRGQYSPTFKRACGRGGVGGVALKAQAPVASILSHVSSSSQSASSRRVFDSGGSAVGSGSERANFGGVGGVGGGKGRAGEIQLQQQQLFGAAARGGRGEGGRGASPVSLSVVARESNILDNPVRTSANVAPAAPSNGGGPARYGIDLNVGSPMKYMLHSSNGPSRQRGREREVRVGPKSRSPPGTGLATDGRMEEANEGLLRYVMDGLDTLDLDNLDNVNRALALLTAKRESIISKKRAKEREAHALIVSPQQQQQLQHLTPPQSISNGGSSSGRARHSSQQRHPRGCSSSGSSSSGHVAGGSEGSPFSGGSGLEALVGSGGGGARSAPTSPSSEVPHEQGSLPPVPRHLSASTAAVRRRPPRSFSCLEELDRYMEHYHFVEQVIDILV